VRGIDDDEGRRLVQIIGRGSGSVVTWRRAPMVVLLSARGMNLVQAEAWLSLARLFLGIASPNRRRWDRQAHQPESWWRQSTQ
jgi:hypothetical protein